MKKVIIYLIYLLGALMIMGGVGHFINPAFYDPMIPDIFPKLFVNIVVGIVEVIVGVGLIIPAYRSKAGLAFFIMMIGFFPIHIIDLMKDNPVVGSFTNAVVRLIIQVFLIYIGWWIWKKK